MVSVEISERMRHADCKYRAQVTTTLCGKNCCIGQENATTVRDFPDRRDNMNFIVDLAPQEDIEKTTDAVLKLFVSLQVQKQLRSRVTSRDIGDNTVLVEGNLPPDRLS